MTITRSHNHPLLPFLAAASGIATFSIMDAAMKSASIAAGVYSALLLRYLIAAVALLPLWRFTGGSWPDAAALKVHVLRSAVVACMAPLFFWGLVRMPLAEAIALSFIAPLIALYLASLLLGEQIRPAAIAASLLGFAGVLVIVAARLGKGGSLAQSGWAIAAILASAVFYAWNLVLQRQQAQIAEPIEIGFFQSVIVAAMVLPAAPWLFAWPPTGAMSGIAFAALLAGISLMSLSWAYARAEAQVLMPIEYTGFIWAALFGWLWFGEAVTLATFAGVVLIVAGCLTATRQPTQITAP